MKPVLHLFLKPKSNNEKKERVRKLVRTIENSYATHTEVSNNGGHRLFQRPQELPDASQEKPPGNRLILARRSGRKKTPRTNLGHKTKKNTGK